MILIIRGSLILSGVFLAGLRAEDVPAALTPPGYALTWSDEFDGTTLDTAKWDYRVGLVGDAEKRPELSTMNRAENVTVSNGLLHILLLKESFPGAEHSGGGIISKAAFKEGFYLARCRMPEAKRGWHSSFWLMNHDNAKPTAIELDVVENDTAVLHAYGVNVHDWQGKPRSWGHQEVKTSDLSADFHLYGAEVSEQKAEYFFDGKSVQTVDLDGVNPINLNIWLTSLVTPWGKLPIQVDDAKSCEYDVDWVRYFKKTGP